MMSHTAINLNLHNYSEYLTKLFSNLCVAKFLDTSTKLSFLCIKDKI